MLPAKYQPNPPGGSGEEVIGPRVQEELAF